MNYFIVNTLLLKTKLILLSFMLINDNNDHIYRYVVSELNKRLVNLTGEEEANLIDDYLSLTKNILSADCKMKLDTSV